VFLPDLKRFPQGITFPEDDFPVVGPGPRFAPQNDDLLGVWRIV
jgi:hypothetical protein